MSTASSRSVGVLVCVAALGMPAVAQSLGIPHGVDIARFVGLSALSATDAGECDARPEPAPPKQTEELEVVTILRKVAAAYAEAATHERVAIKFAGPDGHERFDQMQVSMDPGQTGGAGKRLALSMGSLRVQVIEGLVTAVSESAVGRVFRAVLGEDLSSSSIAKVLPPLPIPALEFLGGRDALAPLSMTPYASGVVWESLAERPKSGQAWAVLRGSAGETRVALTVDIVTWRIRHVEILGRQGARNWSLDCAITPITAPERDPFAPLSGAMNQVPTLADLVAAQLPLEIGVRVPNLTLVDHEVRAWTYADAFDTGERSDEQRLLAFVFYRAGSEAARADAQAAALAVTQTARRAHRDVLVRPVMVCELREFQVTALQREAGHWGSAIQPLASTGGRELLDRFVPGQNSAVVLLDSGHKLLASIGCDGRSADAAGVAAGVREAMEQLP